MFPVCQIRLPGGDWIHISTLSLIDASSAEIIDRVVKEQNLSTNKPYILSIIGSGAEADMKDDWHPIVIIPSLSFIATEEHPDLRFPHLKLAQKQDNDQLQANYVIPAVSATTNVYLGEFDISLIFTKELPTRTPVKWAISEWFGAKIDHRKDIVLYSTACQPLDPISGIDLLNEIMAKRVYAVIDTTRVDVCINNRRNHIMQLIEKQNTTCVVRKAMYERIIDEMIAVKYFDSNAPLTHLKELCKTTYARNKSISDYLNTVTPVFTVCIGKKMQDLCHLYKGETEVYEWIEKYGSHLSKAEREQRKDMQDFLGRFVDPIPPKSPNSIKRFPSQIIGELIQNTIHIRNLFIDILTCTPEGHRDYEDLRKTVLVVKESARRCDDWLTHQEGRSKYLALFRGGPDRILNEESTDHTLFINSYPVTSDDEQKTVILLDDEIWIVKHYKDRHKSGTVVEEKLKYPLISIVPYKHTKFAIQTSASASPVIMEMSSETERNKFVVEYRDVAKMSYLKNYLRIAQAPSYAIHMIRPSVKKAEKFSKYYERYGQCVCAFGTTIWIIGGYTKTNEISSHIFCFEIKPDKIRNASTYNATLYDMSPRAYCATSVCNDKFYIFGGIDASGQWSNELWCFDGTQSPEHKLGFRMLPANGDAPEPRPYCSMTAFGNCLLVMGGQCRFAIHKYDLKLEKWERMTITGAVPKCLYNHTSVLLPNKSIVLIGGQFNEEVMNPSVFVLNNEQMNILSGIGLRPSSRTRHSTIVVDDLIYIFGNGDKSERYPMAFDIVEQRWIRPIFTEGQTHAESDAISLRDPSCVRIDDRLYVVCGKRDGDRISFLDSLAYVNIPATQRTHSLLGRVKLSESRIEVKIMKNYVEM